MVCIFWLFIFVFKQKTAYEMRISDWSSDVCSSDLHAQIIVLFGSRVLNILQVMPHQAQAVSAYIGLIQGIGQRRDLFLSGVEGQAVIDEINQHFLPFLHNSNL